MSRLGCYLGLLVFFLGIGCSGPEQDEQSSAVPDREFILDIIDAAETAQGCAFSWNGEPMSRDDILDRAWNAIQDYINDLGGVENMTEEDFPIILIHAKPEDPFRCLREAIIAAMPAGYAEGELRIIRDQFGASFHLPIVDLDPPPETIGNDVSPVRAVIQFSENGGFLWSGEPIRRDEINDRTRSLGQIAPEEIVVMPSDETSVVEVALVLEEVSRSGYYATLIACADYGVPLPADFAEAISALPRCQ